MFDLLLRILMIVVSLWYMGTGTLLDNTFKVFTVGILLLSLYSFTTYPKRNVKMIYPALFFGYCAFNFIYHGFQSISFLPFLCIMFCGLLFYLVVAYSEKFEYLITTLKIIVLCNLVLAILQILKLDPILTPSSGGYISGFYERTSSLSTLLVMLLPFLSYSIFPIYLIPNITGMVSSIIVVICKKDFRLILVMSLLVISFIYFRYDWFKYKFDNRITYVQNLKVDKRGHGIVYQTAKSVLQQNPILGYGLGTFKYSTISKEYKWNMELKCEPIDWLFSAGIVGIIFVFLFFADLWKNIKQNKIKNLGYVLLGVCVMSLTQGVFQNIKLMVIFIPLMAWIYIPTKEETCK